MAKTIYTESFIEAWEKERCLWDLNFLKTATKSEEQKKIAKQCSVLVLALASHTSLE